MKGKRIEEIGVSSRGMYMCNMWYISNADIPKLYEIPNPAFKNKRYLSRFNLTYDYERKNCYGKQNKNL